MDTETIKKNIHHLIDQINDEELLSGYLRLLEKNSIFSRDDVEMIERAKASLHSITTGRTRDIKDFKSDFEKWRKERSI